ncbi:MAG: spore coat associated protein CotJA [Acetobacter sp.]|nr:spore coat associated protein CotJA [Bacteroides sp.]MCM1341473.1 spore coat associated protein CotJA [Acetobacter sp.]MCM1434166.1 spore coat associated protein CotJA [Clostridiales bacterium]
MESYTDLFKPSFLKKERRSALPSDPQVTMAYIPLQTELITYDDAQGLKEGTIFPELNKPFLGRMVKKS